MAVQRDGKIVVVADANVATRHDNVRCACHARRKGTIVVRLEANGGLDMSFGNRGFTLLRNVTGPSLASLRDYGWTFPQYGPMTFDKSGRLLLYVKSDELLSPPGKLVDDGKVSALLYRLT